MYYCQDCGVEFEMPLIVTETHSLTTPPYEKLYVCPSCKGMSYREKLSTHCRCCGAKLLNTNSDYCNDECKKRGKAMWEAERKRRRLTFTNPIAIIIRETEEYNRSHGTNYSYGQYVAFIRPEVKK